MDSVLIILVNYNGSIDTIECINSILSTNEKNYKIVVIDNNSQASNYLKLEDHILSKENSITINDIEKIKDINYDKGIILYKSEKNLGFGRAHNLIVDSLKRKDMLPQYILVLNNDTIVQDGFINNLIYSFNDDIGIATGKVRLYYKNEIDYAGGSLNYYLHGKIKHFYNDKIIKNTVVSFASGCYFMISRDVLLKLEYLFNPSYFYGYEDLELCFKIQKLGYRILYCPFAQIYHKKGISSGFITSGLKYFLVNYSYNIYINDLYQNKIILFYFWYIIRKIYLLTILQFKIRQYNNESKKEIKDSIKIAYKFYKFYKSNKNEFLNINPVEYYNEAKISRL